MHISRLLTKVDIGAEKVDIQYTKVDIGSGKVDIQYTKVDIGSGKVDIEQLIKAKLPAPAK